MEAFISQAEEILYGIIRIAILFLECAGAGVLIWTSYKAIIAYLKKDEHVALKLAQGIALSLEFKLGGEVLRTVIVREWSELLILAMIVLIRGILTFLIQWEIKNEEKRIALSQEQTAVETESE